MNSGERNLNLRLKRIKYYTIKSITQKSLKYLSLDDFFWDCNKTFILQENTGYGLSLFYLNPCYYLLTLIIIIIIVLKIFKNFLHTATSI